MPTSPPPAPLDVVAANACAEAIVARDRHAVGVDVRASRHERGVVHAHVVDRDADADRCVAAIGGDRRCHCRRAAPSVSDVATSAMKAPPVAVTVMPSPRIRVRDATSAMLMPTAAATDTPPDSVSAYGVSPAPPSPPPPFSCDVLLAKPRCIRDLRVDALLGVRLLVRPPARRPPRRSRSRCVLDVVFDEIVTEPPAVMFRCESTPRSRGSRWLSASATPIEASPPSVSPARVVIADAVCSALDRGRRR